MRDTFGTAQDVPLPLTIPLSRLEQRLVAVESEILRLIREVARLTQAIATERTEHKALLFGDEPFPGSTQRP